MPYIFRMMPNAETKTQPASQDAVQFPTNAVREDEKITNFARATTWSAKHRYASRSQKKREKAKKNSLDAQSGKGNGF